MSLACDGNCACPGNLSFPSRTSPVSRRPHLPTCAPLTVPGSRHTPVRALPACAPGSSPTSVLVLLALAALFSLPAAQTSDWNLTQRVLFIQLSPSLLAAPLPAWSFWVEPCASLGARHPDLPPPSCFSHIPPGDTSVCCHPKDPSQGRSASWGPPQWAWGLLQPSSWEEKAWCCAFIKSTAPHSAHPAHTPAPAPCLSLDSLSGATSFSVWKKPPWQFGILLAAPRPALQCLSLLLWGPGVCLSSPWSPTQGPCACLSGADDYIFVLVVLPLLWRKTTLTARACSVHSCWEPLERGVRVLCTRAFSGERICVWNLFWPTVWFQETSSWNKLRTSAGSSLASPGLFEPRYQPEKTQLFPVILGNPATGHLNNMHLCKFGFRLEVNGDV